MDNYSLTQEIYPQTATNECILLDSCGPDTKQLEEGGCSWLMGRAIQETMY